MASPLSAISRAPSVQVFVSKSGKRWRNIKAMMGLLCLAILAFLAVVVPQAISPVRSVQYFSAESYPREITAQINVNDLTVLGTQEAPLTRVAEIRRDKGVAYLGDPFSFETFRPLTEEEAQEVGNDTYVVERFGQPADKQLMLTFDDGPDSYFTSEILDLLSREGVPATFFAIGEEIAVNPALVNRIVREGHMVGNHTFYHANFYEHPDLRNREELIMTDRVIRAAARYDTRIWRIPEADPENKPLALLQGQQLGYLHVDLSLDTRDWSYQLGQEIPVPELDGKGHVVLLHDGGGDRTETLELLQKFIAEAKSQGYSFTTLEPILPETYVPTKDIMPAVADMAVLESYWTVSVLFARILEVLFWLAVMTMTPIALINLVLAIVHSRRQRRNLWPQFGKRHSVSVIIPAHNEAEGIGATLRSLTSQRYSIDEILVVNDASTDNTAALAQSFANKYPNVRVISLPTNSGKAVALNTGIAETTGEVIVMLDGDTVFEPDTVGMLARRFSDPMVGVVAGHVKVSDRNGVLKWWQSLEYVTSIGVNRSAEAEMGAISVAPGACSAWRRAAIEEVGGYPDDTLAEDADLTMRIQELGNWQVVQEYRAVAWTEAPKTLAQLTKQRTRWSYGTAQVLWKYRHMLLRPRHGMLGMVALPYSVMTLLVPLLFMPLMLVALGISLTGGNVFSIIRFAAFVAMIHLVTSLVALILVRESPKHLLVIPVYRLIYEPLRAYLLIVVFFRVCKGLSYGWGQLARSGSAATPPSVRIMKTS